MKATGRTAYCPGGQVAGGSLTGACASSQADEERGDADIIRIGEASPLTARPAPG